MGKARRLKQDRQTLAPAPATATMPAAGGGRRQASAGRTARASSLSVATLLPPLVIVAIGLVLYANSFSVPFFFDDQIEIINNPKMKELNGPLFYLTQSRGIVLLSLALNYWWGGLDIRGYHLVNVLVHLINALLVYLLVLTTLRLPHFARRYDRHARALALVVGLVFLAHPLQTMAVTYVIQRAESIAALFYLLALLLFVRGSATTDGRAQWLAYAGAAGAGVLGILTKEIVVTLPFMVLFYHVCFLDGGQPRASRGRQWALYALLFLAVAYAVLLSWRYLIPAAPWESGLPRASFEILTAGFALEGVSAWQYFLTQFAVILTYLRRFFLPTHLVFDYGWPFVDSPWRVDVIVPLLVLLAIAAAGVAAFRRYRLAAFCIGWFFLILSPSSSLIPLKDAYFEHRMYLALVGPTWLVVVGAYDLLHRAAGRRGAAEPTVLRAAFIAAIVWVAALGWLTVERNRVYADPLALATDSATKAPHNWRAHYDHGNELRKRGRSDEAIEAFKKSIALDPKQGPPRIHLAIMYLQRNMLEQAGLAVFPATFAAETSVVAAAHRTLGFIFEAQQRWTQALFHFGMAAKLMPEWAMVRKHLARMHAKVRQWTEAAEHYETAMRLNAQMARDLRNEAAEPFLRLGAMNYVGGQPEAAIEFLQTAITYRPNSAIAYQFLGLSYAQLGRFDDAERALESALHHAPDDATAKTNLENVRNRRPVFYYLMPELPPP